MLERENYFNALRLMAALFVTISHCFPLALGSSAVEPSIGTMSLGTIGVVIFFAISGILVTHSFMRLSTARYAWHRFLRIYPALAVCLIVTVIVGSWFGEPGYWRASLQYFINNAPALSTYQASLPTFSQNPTPHAANDSLWTIQLEIKAYAILCAAGLLVGIRKGAWWRYAAILVGVAASPILIRYDDTRQWLFLCTFFAAGFLWYVRDRSERWALPLAIVAVAAALIAVATQTLTDVAMAACLVSLVFLIGPIANRQLWVLRKVDLTYGLYLYSFVVGQAAVGLVHIDSPLVLAVLTVVAAGLMAATSWLLIERPALSLRDVRLDRWRPADTRNKV